MSRNLGLRHNIERVSSVLFGLFHLFSGNLEWA